MSTRGSPWSNGLAISLVALAVSPSPAPVDLTRVKSRPFDPEMSKQLDDYIADFMRRAKVPGAAVAIVQGGRSV